MASEFGRLVTHCSEQIDSRLRGIEDTAAAWSIFDTYDANFDGGLHLVRNPDCWISRGSKPLDVTCISPANSTGNHTRAGVLVSPRHILFATHYQISTGAKVAFVTMDGEIIERTMTAKRSLSGYQPYYPDITVGVLDSDVPSSIGFAKLLPDWAIDTFKGWGGFRVPSLCLDQTEKAIVSDFGRISEYEFMRFVSMIQFYSPASDSVRYPFHESIVGGDSGNPSFLIVDNQLVLLTVWTYGGAGSGTNTYHFRDEINEIMADLGGDYQLTDIDLNFLAEGITRMDRIPYEITAGELIEWSRRVSDYPIEDGWELHMRLVPMAGGDAIEYQYAALGGEFIASIAGSTNGTWSPGRYHVVEYAKKADVQFVTYQCSMTVHPNPFTATGDALFSGGPKVKIGLYAGYTQQMLDLEKEKYTAAVQAYGDQAEVTGGARLAAGSIDGQNVSFSIPNGISNLAEWNCELLNAQAQLDGKSLPYARAHILTSK